MQFQLDKTQAVKQKRRCSRHALACHLAKGTVSDAGAPRTGALYLPNWVFVSPRYRKAKRVFWLFMQRVLA
jgi:hypothetical protein